MGLYYFYLLSSGAFFLASAAPGGMRDPHPDEGQKGQCGNWLGGVPYTAPPNYRLAMTHAKVLLSGSR